MLQTSMHPLACSVANASKNVKIIGSGDQPV